MVKDYIMAKTKASIAKRNRLTAAESKYTSGDGIFYDFSLFDEVAFDDGDREQIEKDLMEHHTISWFERPMPTIILPDKFTSFVGQIETVPHRIFRSNGKRICVIIEVTSLKIERQERSDVWSEYKTVRTYEARNFNTEKDFEVA